MPDFGSVMILSQVPSVLSILFFFKLRQWKQTLWENLEKRPLLSNRQ